MRCALWALGIRLKSVLVSIPGGLRQSSEQAGTAITLAHEAWALMLKSDHYYRTSNHDAICMASADLEEMHFDRASDTQQSVAAWPQHC